MIPIAILASGRGSNFDAIHSAIQSGKLAARITCVLSDQPSAEVLEKAKRAGIPALVEQLPAGTSSPDQRRVKHDEAIVRALETHAPHFLVMAGFMRRVTPTLLAAYRSDRGYSRITNIHPSLLPAFPGMHAYSQAYRYGAQIAGVTVHLVEEMIDSGPICAQESFAIGDCRSEAEVEQRGLAIEHRLYPETLAWVLEERFEIEPRDAVVSGAITPHRRLCVRPN